MERVLVQVVRRRQLHDLAEVHHRDPIGDVPDDGEVVRDEEVREVELALQCLEQIDDLRLDRDVERRHRLVADDEVRIEGQGARKPDSLALTAGELVWIARRGVGGEADDLEQLPYLRPEAPAASEPVHAQRFADDPPDRVPRVERRVRILEHHLHPLAQRPQLRLAEVCDVLAVEDDRATGRLVQAQQGPPDGRLAAAGLADEAERLAPLDRQRDAVDRLDVSDVPVEQEAAADRKPDPEVIDLDEARTVRHAASPPSRERCHSSAGTGLKQRTWCPCSISSRGGTCSRDCSTS